MSITIHQASIGHFESNRDSSWASCDQLRGGIPERDLDARGDYRQMRPVFATAQPSPSAVSEMPAIYFETHFQQEGFETDWPKAFAIITAFATTGEKWPEQKNIEADRALEAELKANHYWLRRLTGFSPSTGHAEPGWAVKIDLATACELGERYLQHAIYYVLGDVLSVALCKPPALPVVVGAFRCRVHTAKDSPVLQEGASEKYG